MSFVQIIEFETSKLSEMMALQEEWRKETAGRRTAARVMSCQDRERVGHYAVIVEFPSYEEAMRNSDLPETDRLSRRMAELADGPIRFTNLDVLGVEED
jgi:hypothetical protein